MLIIILVAILILSVILHELSHGYMALWLGDPTARLAGRLTLNPLPHLDMVGSVLIPLILAITPGNLMFGWAKPVPYNPYNLRNQRWGEALVAGAGPAMNIAIALVFGLALRLGGTILPTPAIDLMVAIVFINILLAFFNLIPIPPLDGSKILSAILPYGAATLYDNFRHWMERYGIISMFLFIFIFVYLFSGPFFALMSYLFFLITGIPLG